MLVKYFRNKLVSPQTGLRLKTLRRVNHILWRITKLRGCCQPNCFSARSISKPAHLQFRSKKIYSIYVSIQSPYKHGAKPTSTWDFLRLTTTTPESAHMLVHSRQVQRPVADADYSDLLSIYGINHFKACDSHVQFLLCLYLLKFLKQSISSTKAEEEWKTVDQAMGLTCY